MFDMNQITKPIYLLDFETQSTHHISDPLYTESPDTKALCMSYGLRAKKPQPPKLWWQGDPCPPELVAHAKAGGYFGASNATFDRKIWNNICTDDHDFPTVPTTQWICTQAQSRVAGLPSALDKSARALGMKHRKDKRGNELITRCCIPPFSQDPQDYADLGAYCLQDWVVMNGASCLVPMLTAWNLDDYHYNEDLNDRGIRIDRELARAASNYAEVEREEINAKLFELTDGEIERCTQHTRVCKWLRECLEDDGRDDALKMMARYKTDKATKETVKKWSSDKNVRANLLAAHDEGGFNLAPDIVDLLRLMDEAGGSAVSKFGKMSQLAHPDDDRVRGSIRYAGAASTQRYSSMGLQVHNFRRDAMSLKEVEWYRGQMLDGVDLMTPEGKPARVMDTLGRLLRSAIIPAKGKVFVGGDWSAVESRMTAYVAGDNDKLDLFRRGGDPYCYAAEGIYGRPISAEKDPTERQVGKVTDLACGFLGGEGALASMATQYRVHVPEDSRKGIVQGYRAKHPKIVAFGDALQKAAIRAVLNPGTWQVAREIKYWFHEGDGALYCLLSDGETTLRYPECRVEMRPVPWDETKKTAQLTALKAAFSPAKDAKEWPRHGLWRGLLLENVVQGNCAIMLKNCALDCEADDLDVTLHVHDELVLEVWEEDAEYAVHALRKIMENPPGWAFNIPLTAEPEVMQRYGK